MVVRMPTRSRGLALTNARTHYSPIQLPVTQNLTNATSMRGLSLVRVRVVDVEWLGLWVGKKKERKHSPSMETSTKGSFMDTEASIEVAFHGYFRGSFHWKRAWKVWKVVEGR